MVRYYRYSNTLFEIFTHPTPLSHNSHSKTLQHDQCNSEKLAATYAMHVTLATDKDRQQTNENAGIVNRSLIWSLVPYGTKV